jgi:hypothetical protein
MMMDGLASMFGAQGVSPGVANLISMLRARSARGAEGGGGATGGGYGGLVGSPSAGAADAATFARMQGGDPNGGGQMQFPATAPMRSGVTGASDQVGSMPAGVSSRVAALAQMIRSGRLGGGGGAPGAGAAPGAMPLRTMPFNGYSNA